jgi:Heterokaryon incompatibility protein (HET)
MQNAARTSFQYEPLQEAGSIRLLKILGFNSANRIFQCELETVLLTQSQSFRALSYTWGDPLEPDDNPQQGAASPQGCEIALADGLLVGITQNLHDALERIHDRQYDGFVWIDAICIDQSNTAERSAQVAIMGEIYSAATQVVIWLGKSDLHLTHFVNMMDNLSAPLDRYITEKGWEKSKAYNIKDPSFYDSLGLLQPTWTQWESYVTFCQRRWFTRSWIVQEAALAKELVVLCAGVELSWENMQFLSVFLKVSRWGPYLSTRFCGSRLSVPGIEQSVIEYFRL